MCVCVCACVRARVRACVCSVWFPRSVRCDSGVVVQCILCEGVMWRRVCRVFMSACVCACVCVVYN